MAQVSGTQMTQEQPVVQQQAIGTKQRPKRSRPVGIFAPCMITRVVPVNIVNIGGGSDSGLKQTLERLISKDIDGKCIEEGYVRAGSVRILTYSSGRCSASDVMFEVVFECQVCCPVEGMHIDCVAEEITETAGIRAETVDKPSPVVVYVARDHHISNSLFPAVTAGQKIKVRVIGQRYELNDKYVSVIGELIEDKAEKYRERAKKRLVIA